MIRRSPASSRRFFDTRVEVMDTSILASVPDVVGLEYKIISATDMFASVNVSRLTAARATENGQIPSLREKDVSLESYSISLIGGGSYAQAPVYGLIPYDEKQNLLGCLHSRCPDGGVIFANRAENQDAVTAAMLFERFYTVENS